MPGWAPRRSGGLRQHRHAARARHEPQGRKRGRLGASGWSHPPIAVAGVEDPRAPTTSAAADDFESRLAELTERVDPFMAWLGVVFALLVGYELAVDLGPTSSRVLEVAGWVIWAAFALELIAELWLAPHRLRFLRRHWLRVLMVAVPTLRVLRFVRLLRLGRALPAARVVSSSYRTAGTARRLVRSRLGYLAALSGVVAVAVAELAYLFERSEPRGAFSSFGDAIVWAFSAVIAMQADPVPRSTGARLAMLGAFAFGLAVVASLAGALGAFFVEERRERAEAPDGDADPRSGGSDSSRSESTSP